MSLSAEIRAFSSKLAEAPDAALEKVTLATAKTTFDTLGDARRATPVKTGYLRASGTTTMSLGTTLTSEITFSAEYAVFVHEGTSRMPPRPFLRDAFEKHTKQWTKALEQIGGVVLE